MNNLEIIASIIKDTPLASRQWASTQQERAFALVLEDEGDSAEEAAERAKRLMYFANASALRQTLEGQGFMPESKGKRKEKADKATLAALLAPETPAPSAPAPTA